MSWVSDLTSGLGLPGAAATLAVGLYSACVAAEKAARPGALSAIGEILIDPSWEQSAKPSVAINRIFVWTFGERQLGWKCIRRSLGATLFVLFAFLLYGYESDKQFVVFLRSIYKHPFIFVTQALCVSALSDYLALAKTRFLVGRIGGRSLWRMALLVGVDMIASVAIACVVFTVYLATLIQILGQGDLLNVVARYLTSRLDAMPDSPVFLISVFGSVITTGGISVLSAIFTSLWITFVLLATVFIKLITPLHRFTGWFFDVSTRPLQAIGVVSGTLVFLFSVAWTSLRSLL